MSKVLFLGQNAGISNEARGGNTNSPFDYFVECGCGAPLGVLGAFGQNPEGYRTIWCKKCEHTTVLDKNAQVLKYIKLDSKALFAIPKKVGT